MRERPILFSAPMVRAILAGTKTQTRRVVKPLPPEDWAPVGPEVFSPTVINRKGEEQPGADAYGAGNEDGSVWIRCPYGQPGDRLWVRETWAPGDEMVFGAAKDDPETVLYRADKAALHWDGKAMRTPLNTYAFNWEAVGWKPSIHMPRWASRITLEVTGVRVERLQDISEADAIAEGIDMQPRLAAYSREKGCKWEPVGPIEAYLNLWESINGHGSWGWNPWVWVVEFKRIDGGGNG